MVRPYVSILRTIRVGQDVYAHQPLCVLESAWPCDHTWSGVRSAL